jgi:ubiquinone/menaquinone biosynthesis C-methylase UbiE
MSDTSVNNLSKIFTDIYKNNDWSMGQNDSKSGLGSSMEYTESIMNSLIKIVKSNDIKSLVDTSCGDWFWFKKIRKQLDCKYTGIDIVNDIIQSNTVNYSDNDTIFINGDFLSILKAATDKSFDLILCRHTCEHLPTDYILEFIKEAKRTSKFLLLTTKTIDSANPVNKDLVLTTTPYRPINLHLPPYSTLLDQYLVEKIYDGPSKKHDPEMYINLYMFY